MVLRSKQFNDVYFSIEDGMAETSYIFLDGNNLPHAWEGKNAFTIGELGFGTGLNFLCAWKLFEGNSKPDQRLDFISVEKYPLSKNEIKNALSPWSDSLGSYIDRYLSLYPLRIPGPHKIHLNDRVSLTIWFCDVMDALPQWNTQIDAWFLDGFTPSKNPDMWSSDIFELMASMSHASTSYATFTAATVVRKNLSNVGFSVEKIKGYGHKRDMIKGVFQGDVMQKTQNNIKTVAIIGGGLAGCAMAYACDRMGIKATIYEVGDSLASGASGGKLGMIDPKLSAKPSVYTDFYTSAYAYALRVLNDIDDVDFNICGNYQICTTDDRDRRFTGYIETLGWHEDHIKRDDKNLIYPDGANVSPFKLCHALAKNADIKLNHKVSSLDDINADIIVVTNGYLANDLIKDDLPIHSVRGQVSWIKKQEDIKQNIGFGGYMTPLTSGGFHVLGSSFHPRETDLELTKRDHKDCIERYNDATGEKISMDDVVGGWAELRTSSQGRFPIVGKLNDKIYISTAHASHGITSSLIGADIILTQVSGGASLVHLDVLKALSPKRFRKH